MIESLPSEIIENILSRLPIKCLLKCTAVCKSWRSKIKNPRFIRAHLSQMVSVYNQSDTHLLLLHCVYDRESMIWWPSTFACELVEELYSLHYDNHGFDEYCNIEFPTAHKEELCNAYFRVFSVCNGLVFLADDIIQCVNTFIIWNPSIRKSVTLPRPNVTYCTHGGYDATVGFGYDAVNSDYKVVRLVSLLDMCVDENVELSPLVEVYSLAAGSWRLWSTPTVVAPVCQIEGRALQAFVNGALHWPAFRWTNSCNSYFILTFDLGTELFREILMPKSFICDGSLGLRLSVSGDRKSLALFTMNDIREDYFLDIWVMEEYGIKESWTKLITVVPQGPVKRLPGALCFRKSSEVLLMLDKGAKYAIVNDGNSVMFIPNTSLNRELVSLDLVSKEFKNLGICGDQYCFVDSYEESLVLLDKVDAVSY